MYKHLSANDLKKHFKLPQNYRVDACIIYGDWREKEIQKYFLSSLKNKKYKKEKLEYKFLNKILSININGKRIWFIVEYGGVRLSEFLHLACMFGSKKNILVGCCGGLKKGLNEFSIIVPTYTYSQESSCHMYVRNNKDNKFYPDKKLSKDTSKKLEKEIEIINGPIITCQAMLAEKWSDIVTWSKRGFYGVEMESSTVFSVSKHFKVPATAMLNIADNLIEKEMFGSESYKKKRKKLIEIKKLMIKTALEISLK